MSATAANPSGLMVATLGGGQAPPESVRPEPVLRIALDD